MQIKPIIIFSLSQCSRSVHYHKCNFISHSAIAPHLFLNVLALLRLLYSGGRFSVQLLKWGAWRCFLPQAWGNASPYQPPAHFWSWIIRLHYEVSLPLLLWESCDYTSLSLSLSLSLCLSLSIYIYISLSQSHSLCLLWGHFTRTIWMR